jgi:predicted phosphodiesterase
MIGVIGDIHGDFGALFRILESNTKVTHWFQVGDLGGEYLSYPNFPSNFFFIRGNHENWDEIEGLKPSFMENGGISSFTSHGRPFKVAVLGGNYSSRFYSMQRKELSGARRRHFVEEEVTKLLNCDEKVDILLTHEAAQPFRKGSREMGQPIVTDILKGMRPAMHFFGHHHYFGVFSYDGVPSVGLPYGSGTYLLYDFVPGEFEKVDL